MLAGAKGMSVVCRAPPSTEAVGTRVRKNMSARSMSREFSDSEVHQRVRRKPCTALATYKPQWQEGMEVPRSLIACLSMLDLVSSEEESPGSRLRGREGSWCSLAGSALGSVLVVPGKTPRFRRVMSAGVLEEKAKGERLATRPRGHSARRLSPLPSDSDSDTAPHRQQQQQQGGVTAAAPAVQAAVALSPEPMELPPPPEEPPSRFKSLVPTCFQWFGACHMVYLAGSFNEWKERIPLQSCGRNKDWAVVLNLPPGEYTYKYVVQAAAEDGLSWHHAPDQPAGRDQLGNVNNFATVMDQSEFEVEEAEDAGYSQHEPDENFFLAPEPPSLPPHLLHLLGDISQHAAEAEPPAADTMLQGGMQWGELQGLQGLPMPEGVPLQRSGVSGIMEGMRLGEGAGDAAEHVAQSRGEYIDHSALEHLCVSMDYSHGGGPQGGHAAAGRSSLPPAVALSVIHRYRGRVIETVLVKPLPVQAGLDAARPAPPPGVPVGQW